VIKVVRPSYYGKITADVDANIQRWMEKSGWEIIKEQASRVSREFSYWIESE
jgi:endonuclease III